MSTMLPSTPKSFGDIRHVFSSGLSALLGESNPFGLKPTNHLVSVLVDGLGVANLKGRAGHAPFLSSNLVDQKPISAGYPSTTATSITSFATGLLPGQHGIVGYRIQDPVTLQPMNLLSGWRDGDNPLDWQGRETISARAVKQGVKVYFIGSPEYEHSGFTSITMPNAQFVSSKSIEDSFTLAASLVQKREKSLIYLYLPQLDQAAHAHGWNSVKWSNLLEQLDSSMDRFVRQLAPDQSATLTADHGVVDVSDENKLFLDEAPQPKSGISLVGGDTRAAMVYLRDATEEEPYSKLLSDYYSRVAYVLNKADLIATGWYGDLATGIEKRLPEITILAKSQVAFYHRDFASANSLKMIGHHGSISTEELLVPFLKFGQIV